MKRVYSYIGTAVICMTLSACSISSDRISESPSNNKETKGVESEEETPEEVNEPEYVFALSNYQGSKLLVIKKTEAGTESSLKAPEKYTNALIVTEKGFCHSLIKYNKYQKGVDNAEGLRDNANHFDSIEGWLYDNEDGAEGSEITNVALLTNTAFMSRYEILGNLKMQDISSENSVIINKQFGKDIHSAYQFDIVSASTGKKYGSFVYAVLEIVNGEATNVYAWISADNSVMVREFTEKVDEESVDDFYELNDASNGAFGVQSVFIDKDDDADINFSCWDSTGESVNNYILSVKDGKLISSSSVFSRYVIE